MDDNLVPIVAILMIFGLPIGGWITMRILAHRERMAMLARGYVPATGGRGWQPMPPPGNWSAPGGSPGPSRAADQQAHWNLWCESESSQDSLRRGIRTTMIGIALLIGLSFIGYRSHGGPFGGPTIEPGPWLLGGLIPTFVGLAQILVARLSGARFGPPPMPGYGPPGAAPGSPFSAQPPPAARPVHPAEELPSPLRPPERF